MDEGYVIRAHTISLLGLIFSRPMDGHCHLVAPTLEDRGSLNDVFPR